MLLSVSIPRNCPTGAVRQALTDIAGRLKPRLAGITKRGNCYLRKLLIHGARAVLPTLSKSETPLGG
jgi:transposase